MQLSREAFQKLSHLEKSLDSEFGSLQFRKTTIDPMLEKERQIDAIMTRARQGGKIRTSDKHSLDALLGRKMREFEALKSEFPWASLSEAHQQLVKNYIDERRAHLQLGDPERVRSSYREALSEYAIAS